MYNEGLGGEQYEVIDANAWETTVEYFMNDQLGIYLSGNWIPSNFMTTGVYPWEGYEEKIGFAKMPLQEGNGFITLSGGWALTISEVCPNPDLAFEFITKLMDPEIAYPDYVIPRGNLSPRTELNDNETYTAVPFTDVATSYLDFTAYRPANENYSTISSYIYTAVEQVVTGTTPEEALAGYDKAVTELVGEEFVKDCGHIAK